MTSIEFPVECSDCGTEYNSLDELKEKQKDSLAKTYHCPECTITVPLLKIDLKQGNVLHSKGVV